VAALYRVFPYLAEAAGDAPGGALHVPQQGGGRLDNPELYSAFYASSAEAGAVAEAFGRFPEWSPAVLEGIPSLVGSVRAIARYLLGDDVKLCDLDDPHQLAALGLRPSDVVSREYARTREWARRIFQQREWAGVRWWSYYDPRWNSVGLWSVAGMALEDVRILRLDDAAIAEAARTISRRIVGK